MSKKNRLPAEESFTLQFGDPDEGEVSAEEFFSPGDVEFDEQFMWRNAAAGLSEQAAASRPDPSPVPVEMPVQAQPDEATAPDEFEPVDEDVENAFAPDVPEAEPLEEARLGAAAALSPEAVQSGDEDADFGMPEVIDERQAEMIRAPLDRVAPQQAEEAVPERAALRPAAPIVAPVPPMPDAITPRARQNRALFDNEPELPPASVLASANQGSKAPWVLYGTLGVGVAVLGIAFVGMTLELTKPSEDAPTIEVAAVAERVTVPQDGVSEGDIAAQTKVYRLAVGPFFDSNSRMGTFGQDAEVASSAPVLAQNANPEAPFVADFVTPAPASMPAQTVAALGLETVGNRVVTLGEDRIEIDLTDGENTPEGSAETSGAQASVTIDPKISSQNAPALAATQSGDESQSPAQDFAAAALFEQTMTLSEEINLQNDFLTSQSGVLPEPDAPQLIVAALGNGPKGPKNADMAVFSLQSEIFSAFAPASRATQPVASVLVADGFEAQEAARVGGASGIEVAALQEIKTLDAPVLPNAPEATDAALPAPELDNSRALLAARMRTLELEARQVDGYLARAGAETTGVIAEAARLEAAAAQIQADAAKAALAGLVPLVRAPEAVPQDAPVERIATITPIAPKPDDTSQIDVAPTVAPVVAAPDTTAAPRVWLREAQWIPAFDLELTSVDDAGRPELEIAKLTEADYLPDWVGEGARIVSVAGVAASSQSAVMGALLDAAERQAGEGAISVNMEIRARAGLDPRTARVDIPVWRRVVAGDGTVFAVRRDGQKWVARVQTESAAARSDLKVGDILLRDVATKSRLASAEALEDVLSALEADTTAIVEFAIMRGGALASAVLSLED